MTACFTYMGTKRRISGSVAEVIARAQRGPLLDLFAGISAVGSAVAPNRNVWCNDVQYFAHSLATAMFSSRQGPNARPATISEVETLAHANARKLNSELFDLVSEEDRVIADGGFERGARLMDKLIKLSTSEQSYRLRRMHRHTSFPRPYRLFAITYAGGYVGIRQAIELDSLRYALDQLRMDKVVSEEQHRWLLLALCKALANIANTTGHFAQYLSVKENTYQRLLAKRRRSIFSEWRNALEKMAPEGTPKWRNGNLTFRMEANRLLKNLPSLKVRPSVIYADPPYTRDHYSRYYHLLDTLILYDYPDPFGKGQYRSDRFTSDFSIRSRVEGAFLDLVSSAADLGCDLVINYPEVGLLDDPRNCLLRILKQYFSRAEIALTIAHEHSSLGASKGLEKSPVTELVFYAH